MIKYRPHKGSLSDAMSEMQKFNYVSDMLWFIERYTQGAVSVGDVVISESYGEDNRIGWKSWRYVCTVRWGSIKYDVPQCIGMCDLGELG